MEKDDERKIETHKQTNGIKKRERYRLKQTYIKKTDTWNKKEKDIDINRHRLKKQTHGIKKRKRGISRL